MERWCFLFGDGASRGHNSSNNKANASTSAESVASAETVYYRRGGEAGKEKRAQGISVRRAAERRGEKSSSPERKIEEEGRKLGGP